MRAGTSLPPSWAELTDDAGPHRWKVRLNTSAKDAVVLPKS